MVRKMADFPIVVETYRECLDRRPRLAGPPSLSRRHRESGTSRSCARDGEIPSPFASDPIFRFTQTFSTSGTSPVETPHIGSDPADVGAARLSCWNSAYRTRLRPGSEGQGHPLGRPTRWLEAAFRRPGDLTPWRDWSARWPRVSGRSGSSCGTALKRIEIEGTVEPRRFIGDEDAPRSCGSVWSK